MNQTWSVIIFCYNEENTIETVIDSVRKFLVQNKLNESELIIVDDGSTDESERIIRRSVQGNKEINYIRFPRNMGIGKALLAGYRNAKKENVVAVPADGQFDISELTPYINFPEKSFISFYREELNNYSAYRKLVSGANKQFNRHLLSLDIRDVNWVKAYKTNDLRKIDLKLDSSMIGSEICAKLIIKNFKVIESESVYHTRSGGRSRGASIKTLSQAAKDLFKLATVIRKFRKEKHD